LAGLFFVHIAAALAPLNISINQRRMRLSRLAAWTSLAYLLLIPLLGFAVWRGIANVERESARQVSEISRNADRLIAAIERANTSKELQSSMAQLQGPRIGEQELSIPLDQVKLSLKKIVLQLRAKFIEQLPKPTSEAFKPFYAQALRASALALMSSIGFAALSYDDLKQQTLLRSLFSKSPDPNRGSFYRSLQKLIEKAGDATRKYAQRAEFLAILRRRQKDSDRAKVQHEREMKRNAEMQRKMAAVREKKRLQAERQARKRRDG
jgi:hypothetical protein